MAATRFKVGVCLSVIITSSLILAADVIIPDFVSIDCGTPVESVDPYTGFSYKSDKDLINSGVSSQISPELSEYYDLQYRTLRSFPVGVKNCYTLRPEGGRNNNYLIRAIFLYGNYDGKNSTPVFRVYLGVNLWDTITSDNIRIDAIHMALTDYIDVCFVNIGTGIPYISILELRRLHNLVYRTLPQLFPVLWYRYDLATDQDENLRYPQDVDDRIWIPYEESGSELLKKMKTNASIIIESSNKDDDDPNYKLPELMLQTAYGTQNSSLPFVYTWTPYASSSTFYFCFHFAEIQNNLDSVREMSIVLNDIHTIAESVKLQYLKPQTICSTSAGLPVNLNQLNYLQISAVSTSNLPPIINGFEVYYLMNRSQPTFLQDVNAIRDMKKMLRVLDSEWQGDPCLPTISVWNGLNCSRSNPPRIISLNLSRSKLTGEIPFSISSLTQLETLDLSYNDFSGSLPEFLAQLPRLKILNLDGNNIGGLIPGALLVKSRDGVLDLSVTGNPELCFSPPCKKKSHSFVPVIVAVLVAALLLICFGILLLIIHMRNKKKNLKRSIEERLLKSNNRQVRYSEILVISDNLKTIIGEGGFGKVYYGALSDKTQVAIKLLSASSRQGSIEFKAEAQILTIVHHRNLVSLIGYCDEAENKALIYEFMANGNLRMHLSDPSTQVLSWIERLQIAFDAAQGLEYLHNGCKPPIIHRDMKTSNILLNERMQAKISDFGLSRVFANENDTHLSTCPAGTFGYVDPTIHLSGNFTKKSDVYSFGIVLFELVTGQPAIIKGSEYNIHIVDWAKPFIEEGNIQNIVDPRLEGCIESCCSVEKIVKLALSCTLSTSEERPDINDVVSQLIECLKMVQDKMPQMPQKPLNDTEIFSYSYNSIGSESLFSPR